MLPRRKLSSIASPFFFLLIIRHALAHPGAATITPAPLAANNLQMPFDSGDAFLKHYQGGIADPEVITTAPPFWKRQANSNIPAGFVGYVAPDGVCGYNTGVGASTPTFCAATETCVVSVRQPNPIRGCCNTGVCTYYTHSACSDPSMYSTVCGTTGCSPGTGLCTNTGRLNCYSYSIIGPWGSITAWGCIESQPSRVLTYSSGTLSSWQALNLVASTTAEPTNTPSDTTTLGELPTVTESTEPSATDSAAGTRTVAAASETIASNRPTQTSSPSSTPIGAIVGGTIGGVAVLGIVACLFFFIHRKYSAGAGAGGSPKPPGGNGNQGQVGHSQFGNNQYGNNQYGNQQQYAGGNQFQEAPKPPLAQSPGAYDQNQNYNYHSLGHQPNGVQELQGPPMSGVPAYRTELP